MALRKISDAVTKYLESAELDRVRVLWTEALDDDAAGRDFAAFETEIPDVTIVIRADKSRTLCAATHDTGLPPCWKSRTAFIPSSLGA